MTKTPMQIAAELARMRWDERIPEDVAHHMATLAIALRDWTLKRRTDPEKAP